MTLSDQSSFLNNITLTKEHLKIANALMKKDITKESALKMIKKGTKTNLNSGGSNLNSGSSNLNSIGLNSANHKTPSVKELSETSSTYGIVDGKGNTAIHRAV